MLQGRYRIEQEIGIGPHGKVYCGIDQHTNTPIAIKHLHQEIVHAEPDMLKRIQHEAGVLGSLNHPNIGQVIDTFTEHNDHYIIMEYLASGSLQNLLQEKPCLPVDHVLHVAMDLSDALIWAHHVNIIHRNLKPTNILFATDGTPHLTDFGVVLMIDQESLAKTHRFFGTLNYIAPEILNGEASSVSTDIWAFGVILYEMLAGICPFFGDTATELVVAILTHDPVNLEILQPNLPSALIDLVYRMIDKNPLARIGSVKQASMEFEVILKEFMSGEALIPYREKMGHTAATVDTDPKINLPSQTTSFIGREGEIADLLQMLRSQMSLCPRLVTLIGPGGIGKSRLALETAYQLLDARSNPPYDGIYFVALAPLLTPTALPYVIAETLDYSIQPDGREPLQQIGGFLFDRCSLLILDNFEHSVTGTAVIAELLEAASGLTILVTSRERLNLGMEHLFPLVGLKVPPLISVSPTEYSAVRLFVQGVERVAPHFKLEPSDMAYIAIICQLVEGVPLGLIIASAWSGILTPKEIAIELAQTRDLMEITKPDTSEHQRSIQAVFEYSWQKLDHTEQQSLSRLAIFQGPFSRAAAQAVTGASLWNLMQLVNKSLLHRDSKTGFYCLHEIIRQVAESYLKKQPVDYEAVSNAHSHYYARNTDIRV